MLRQSLDGTVALDEDLRTLLEGVEGLLTKAGHSIFLAHRREAFGAALMDAETCTPLDMLELQRADLLVAIPGFSYGVHIEIGWAIASYKPIVLLRRQSEPETTPLIAGLPTVAHCQTVVFPEDIGSIATDPVFRRDLLSTVEMTIGNTTYRSLRRWAFLSSAFGFGPASKAVAIAREVAERELGVQLHFFGSGVDRDYARKSRVFDAVFKLNVDDRTHIQQLVPQLEAYEAVIAVITPHIAEIWPEHYPPLYYVDSLAWMWSDLPAGMENVRAYFIQDFLFTAARLDGWSNRAPIKLIGPIITQHEPKITTPDIDSGSLLINLSGCANPFGDHELYQRYAETLVRLILEELPQCYTAVTVCCNDGLALWLQQQFPRISWSFGHLAPDRFQEQLRRSQLVLTSPGITTVLEALALNKPLRFLLPQNYSQALLSEQYSELLGPNSTMALSHYGTQVAFGIPEAEGVASVKTALDYILAEAQEAVREKLHHYLTDSTCVSLEPLQRLISQKWPFSGQYDIAQQIIKCSVGKL